MQVPGDWNVQVHCARGSDGHRRPGHVRSHSGSRCPRAAVFCLSLILRSFPRVTGLSAPRTRGRIGTNMVEKKTLTEANAPGVCVCSHPQLFAGYQGFQNVLICSGHSPVTPSLSRSPQGRVGEVSGQRSGREHTRCQQLSGLWVCPGPPGVGLPPVVGGAIPTCGRGQSGAEKKLKKILEMGSQPLMK